MDARSIWIRRLAIVTLGVLVVAFARECALHSVDFPIYHRVARQVLSGDYELYPSAVYDGGTIPPHGFRYAPAIAFLFVPFGWLPLEIAALVFFALKLAALAYAGAVIGRRAGLAAGQRWVLTVAFVAVGGYAVEEFRYGNAHFLCIALMVLAYDRVESGRVATPALALGLAIATKLTPIVLLGYFLLRRRAAVGAATAAVLAALALAPAAVVGMDANNRLLKGFSTYAIAKIDEQDNYGIRGVLIRYLTSTHAADVSHLQVRLTTLAPETVTAIWVFAVLALAGAAFVAIRREDERPVVRLLEFSIVLTGMTLASPHTQRRYFVALYVPVAVLLAIMVRHPPGRDRRTMQLGVLATAASGTVLPLVFGGRTLALWYEACSPYAFGTLILFAVLTLTAWRCKKQRTGSPQPFSVPVRIGAPAS